MIGMALALAGLPDFEDRLAMAEWQRIDGLITAACGVDPCASEPLEEAIARGTRFLDHVVVDARITYLVGLAHHRLGRLHEARDAYERAVALDPTRTDAWHDLGAIALQRGELDLAQRAFQEVDARRDGKLRWLGAYRLAEVAGERGDPEGFESHLKRALQRGFSLRMVQHDARWRGFYRSPVLGPAARRLVTVYGGPDIQRALER